MQSKQFKSGKINVVHFIVELLIIIFILNFSINNFLSIFLKHIILTECNSGNAQCTIGKLTVSLLGDCIEANQIVFIRSDSISLDVHAGKFSMAEIGWYEIIKSKTVELGSVKIIGATINLHKIDSAKLHSLAIEESKDSRIDVNSRVTVKIREISLMNSIISYYPAGVDSTVEYYTSESSIVLKNFVSNPERVNDKSNPVSFNLESIDLRNFTGIISDSLYTLSFENIKTSDAGQYITFNGFRIIPNYSRSDFYKKTGRQGDIITLHAREIAFARTDLVNLILNNSLDANLIRIDSVDARVYRNKYVRDIVERKRFIQELLKGIKIPVRIKEVEINNSSVEYEELLPPSRIAGKVRFEKLNASLSQISNHESDSDEVLTINATARLFGESQIITDVHFPLGKLKFYGKGRVYHVKLSNMNSMLEASTGATITDGFIDSMKFDVHSNNHITNGNMTMVYHDLRVATKDIEKRDTTGIILSVKSFIANTFIIKQSNPEKGKPVRRVSLHHVYHNDRFVISNLWKTILGGFKRSVGVNSDGEN